MIPDEAIEAANAAYLKTVPTGDGSYQDRAMRAALEAAAPHMLAGAWDEGRLVGIDECAGDVYDATNPYRPTDAD